MKSPWLFVFLTALSAALFYLAGGKPLFTKGDAVLPAFDETGVFVVTTEKNGRVQTFIKDKTGRWSILEKDGAFVEDGKIDGFVLRLKRLEKGGAASAVSDFYAEEGVDEATGCLVTLAREDGSTVVSVVVGKSFDEKGRTGRFVRLVDDKKSWRVFPDGDLCPQE